MYIGENKILSEKDGVIQHEGGQNKFAPRVLASIQTEESLDNAELQNKIRTLVVGEIQQVFLDYDLSYGEIEAITSILGQSLSQNRGQGIAKMFGKKFYADITMSDIHKSLTNS
jgi:hypothetical protein